MKILNVLTLCIVFLLGQSVSSSALADGEKVTLSTHFGSAEKSPSAVPLSNLVPSITFFQLDESSCPWYSGGKKIKWEDIVPYVSSLKYDTIIIQHVQLAPDRDLFKGADYKSMNGSQTDDPIENIFRAADASSIKVYLGLRNDSFTSKPNNYADKTSLSSWLSKMGDTEVSTIAELAKSYGYHSSFAGWYIPTEFYAFTFAETDDRTIAVGKFLKRVATECKLKKNVPVAASMFRGDSFDDKPETYSQLSKTYAAVLNDSNVDEILVQDQIGNVGNTCNGLKAIYGAIQSACSQSRVNIKSTSLNSTTYSTNISAGATSNIALAPSTGIQQSLYNSVNELIAQAPGGLVNVAGNANKPVTSINAPSSNIRITASPLSSTVSGTIGSGQRNVSTVLTHFS